MSEDERKPRQTKNLKLHRIGEVIDPEDGLVWRWEKDIEAADG